MKRKSNVKIAIIDDHSMFIDGLKSILNMEAGFSVVAHAGSLSGLADILLKAKVDVLLLDLNLGKEDGLSIIEKTKRHFPKLKIIILTTYNLKKQIGNIKALQVDGYLRKNTSSEQLIHAIWEVFNGGKHFEASNEQAEIKFKSNPYEHGDAFLKKCELTQREVDVIRLLAGGASSKEIGETLNISEFTVKAHRRNIKSKLRLSSTSEITQFAIKMGIIDL